MKIVELNVGGIVVQIKFHMDSEADAFAEYAQQRLNQDKNIDISLNYRLMVKSTAIRCYEVSNAMGFPIGDPDPLKLNSEEVLD